MTENTTHTKEDLKMMQSLPLSIKVRMTEERIRQWHQYWGGNVCVSFSGGKDSTVLMDIARGLYPDIPAVFSNTGLEYPEIQRFVKEYGNVDVVTPSMKFVDVVTQYGYPLIGKEVAEAIYYARRIRSQTGNVERERERTEERKRPELCGKRRDEEGISREQNGATPDQPHRATRTSVRRSNKAPQNRASRKTGRFRKSRTGVNRGIITDDASMSETLPKTKTHSSTSQGTQDGRIGEGGVFSNQKEQIGAKSQFNKEKWLPLCQKIPALISHRCCGVMKKSPMHKYQTKHGYKPILATLAEESRIRKQGWIRHGCNAYEGNIMSQPMSFWTEQDVLAYIVLHDLKIASVYGEIVSEDKKGNQYPPIDLTGECRSGLKCTGCQRTGCIFCAFGFHSERSGETRFQRLARTHPRQYEYCISGGKWTDNPYYDPTAPKVDGDWENWNPKKIWVPSEKGMGMGQLFDMVNEIYGKDFYRYE